MDYKHWDVLVVRYQSTGFDMEINKTRCALVYMHSHVSGPPQCLERRGDVHNYSQWQSHLVTSLLPSHQCDKLTAQGLTMVLRDVNLAWLLIRQCTQSNTAWTRACCPENTITLLWLIYLGHLWMAKVFIYDHALHQYRIFHLPSYFSFNLYKLKVNIFSFKVGHW